MSIKKWTKEDMKRMIDEETRKLEELAEKDPVGAVQAIIGFYKGLGYTQEEIDDLLKSKVTKPVETEGAQKWKEREAKEMPVGTKVAVLKFPTNEDASIAKIVFEAIMEKKTDYRSAVLINDVTVRAVECPYGSKFGGVIILVTAGHESALGIRMLFDGTLNREATVIGVTSNEKMVSVSYTTTGIKMVKKKQKEKTKTGSVFDEEEHIEFQKKWKEE